MTPVALSMPPSFIRTSDGFTRVTEWRPVDREEAERIGSEHIKYVVSVKIEESPMVDCGDLIAVSLAGHAGGLVHTWARIHTIMVEGYIDASGPSSALFAVIPWPEVVPWPRD